MDGGYDGRGEGEDREIVIREKWVEDDNKWPQAIRCNTLELKKTNKKRPSEENNKNGRNAKTKCTGKGVVMWEGMVLDGRKER